MKNFKKIKCYPPIKEKVKEIIFKKFPQVDLDITSYETFMDFIYCKKDEFTDIQMLYFQIFSCKLNMVETEHFNKIETYMLNRTYIIDKNIIPNDLQFYISNL